MSNLKLLFHFAALFIVLIGVVPTKSSITTASARVPYVVSLEDESGQFCSGSIVRTRWILTDADCIWNKLPNELTIGIQPQDDVSGGHHERVHKIYLSPDYVEDSPQAGVALMPLKKPVHWNERIVSIDVVKNDSISQQARKCLLIGWDRYNNSSFRAQQVEIWSSDRCNNTSKKNLCFATQANNSLCHYHKGSPLLCQKGDSFEQVGVFSGSKDCSRSASSEMLINLGDFSEWIKNVITGRRGSLGKSPSEEAIYPVRLSHLNWLIMAISFFFISVTIFIKVLRSGFKVV